VESESRDLSNPTTIQGHPFPLFILRVIKKSPINYSKLQTNPHRKAIIFPQKIICFPIFVAHAYYSDSSFLLLKAKLALLPYPLSLSLSPSLSKEKTTQLPAPIWKEFHAPQESESERGERPTRPPSWNHPGSPTEVLGPEKNKIKEKKKI
jgi:hypothetical protein